MERAVKLALVDPAHLEYRDLAKTPHGQVRARLSLEMRDILNDPRLPDDLRVKLYRQTNERFMTVTDRVPDDDKLPPVSHFTPRRPPPPPPALYEPVETRSQRKKKQKELRWQRY
jgi:hypothetical protein